MTCTFKACSYNMMLAVLAAIGVFIVLGILLYAYIAYITNKYYSDDLFSWKENKLEKVEKEISSQPLE